MKKVMLAVVAGMLASSVMAVEADVTATEETYNADHFTSLYFSAGCGFDWMKNKGDVKDSTGPATIKKQSPSSFVGVFGVGYQRVFAQHFLAGLEFDCIVGQKKDNDLYLTVKGKDYQLPGSKIKNKSVALGLFAKFGYTFCGKHLLYSKLGIEFPGSKITLCDVQTNKVAGYDVDKGVFAATLGYQYKFSSRFSGFGEVAYTSRQKKDFEWNYVGANGASTKSKWAVKSRGAWGVRVGVACHL